MVARVIITTMTTSSTETITAVFEPPVLGFTSNREKKSYSVIIIIIRVAMGWLTGLTGCNFCWHGWSLVVIYLVSDRVLFHF